MDRNTKELLKECDAGIKTAQSSIGEVIDSVKSRDLKRILEDSKRRHGALENKIERVLEAEGETGREPNAAAKAATWMKINFKMGTVPCDATVAEVMFDGCSMGVKALSKYLNKYDGATEDAKNYARKLIEMEDTLMKDLRAFL